MGEKDITLARYFKDDGRYADLINGYAFHGRIAVRAQDIQEKDTRVTGIFGYLDHVKGKLSIQKYRDIVRKVVFGTDFVIVGLEHQSDINYAMPIRLMLEDAAGYDEQLRNRQKRHRRQKDLQGAEYISGFSASDRVSPIVTLVIYYGQEPWSAAKELSQLIQYDGVPQELRELVNNYRIHLLEVRNYTEIEHFQTDLREVFGFIQCSNDKKRIREFAQEHQAQLEHLDEDAFDVITALTGSQELEQAKEKNREGGSINMCKAIQELIEDGRQEGIREGILEGKDAGSKSKAETVAKNMYLRGMSAEDTAAICEEDLEQIKDWFEKWKKSDR